MKAVDMDRIERNEAILWSVVGMMEEVFLCGLFVLAVVDVVLIFGG